LYEAHFYAGKQMKNRSPNLFLSSLILCITAVAVYSQTPGKPLPAGNATARLERAYEDQITATQHQILLNGQALKYTARVGRLPIRESASGEIHGYMFFVAYAADRPQDQKRRPLTFVWNGGPGASSAYVHLVGFGPRRIKGEDDPVHPPSFESEMEDNEATWLDQTDLVFVDPIGTGFSRATRPEYEAEFFNVRGDIKAMAEFIRVYRDRFEAWDAPLFLAGESYGTWRASGVAEAVERGGIRVAGVVIISGGLPIGNVGSDEMKTALYLPRLTAAAFFHKKLSPDLQADLGSAMEKAEAWARSEYVSTLQGRDKLTWEQRQAVITQLARFTGLDPAVIDREQYNLTISSSQFCRELLRGQNLTCALLDDRITNQKPASGKHDLMMRYVRSELLFNTDLSYEGGPAIEQGYTPSTSSQTVPIGQRWVWNQAKVVPANPANHVIYSLTIDPEATNYKDAIIVGSGNGPPGIAEPWLRRAIAIDPALKVFVAMGVYDSLNSCAHTRYIIGQADPSLGHNIKLGCYESGHVIYQTKQARLELKRDIANFIRERVVLMDR
jgi:carboxypeptidase C (cathepsin A)